MKKLSRIFDNAIKEFSQETSDLRFLPEHKNDREIFPSRGQYDWFSGQLLYCLIRYLQPRKIIEISTSSGYSTLFMALALKKNKGGRVFTFEIDQGKALAARLNFRRFQVSGFIVQYIGDAQRELNKIRSKEDADILFLDSLHTAEFARWFIRELVIKSTNREALFQMHDVLPHNAQVRKFGGPPWGVTSANYYRRILWKAYNFFLGQRIEEVNFKINPAKGGGLSTYNGNEGTEAELGNQLTGLMLPSEFVYCYDIADRYNLLLHSRDYDKFAGGYQNRYGQSFEWNNAMWCYVSALKRAYQKLYGSKS